MAIMRKDRVNRMTTDYCRGYAAGHLAAQPEWISMKDRLPEHDGHYFTITESLKGALRMPIGTIAIDTAEEWHRGKWRQNDKYWKVLYWAKPVALSVPDELMRRPRVGRA